MKLINRCKPGTLSDTIRSNSMDQFIITFGYFINSQLIANMVTLVAIYYQNQTCYIWIFIKNSNSQRSQLKDNMTLFSSSIIKLCL